MLGDELIGHVAETATHQFHNSVIARTKEEDLTLEHSLEAADWPVLANSLLSRWGNGLCCGMRREGRRGESLKQRVADERCSCTAG